MRKGERGGYAVQDFRKRLGLSEVDYSAIARVFESGRWFFDGDYGSGCTGGGFVGTVKGGM